MKDRLGRAKLRNIAPNNPTQTMFSRFVKKPGSSLHTGWTDAVNKYEKAKKIVMHTQVMDIFDGD